MKEPFPEAIDQRLVRSLAHPLRIQILELLTDHVASPNALAGQNSRPASATSPTTRARSTATARSNSSTPRSAAAPPSTSTRRPPAPSSAAPPWRKVPQSMRGGVSAATLQTFLDKAIAALEAGTLDGRDDTVFRWMPLLARRGGLEGGRRDPRRGDELMLAAHVRSQDRLSENGRQDTVSTVVGHGRLRDGGLAEAA